MYSRDIDRVDTAMWPPSLLNMLRITSSTLRQMTLTLHPLDRDYWEDLSVLFKLTPYLTHLDLGSDWKIKVCTLVSPSMGKLTIDGAQNIILPDLEHIGFVLQLDDDIMTKILALAASSNLSRLSPVNGVRPLTEIHVHYLNPEFRVKSLG
ncbi:hypothetical protein L218DRAFT_1080627 [Marasmius fiardii PR-910]|nr:hypothetical protein L218DRAFT_1080627 [Marasmius fiardii PR-910]